MTRDPCMSPTQPGTPTGTRDAGAAPGSSRHPEPRPAAKPKHDTLTHEETVCADAHVPWHHRSRLRRPVVTAHPHTFVIEPAGVNSGFCWRSTFWQNSYYMSYTCVLLHDLYILLHRGEAVPMHQCLHLLQSEF